MWKDLYNQNQLTLDIELTTHCNARCPQCSRTNEKDNVKRKPWLELMSVDVDTFAKWFPPNTIDHVKNYHFSGTYGDPGMCKDLDKIVDYILSNSERSSVSVNTNGSMRDSQWWWTLGARSGRRLKFIFDVDGINQEMHSFYRRGTDLATVLDNLEAVLDTDAKVSVLTVLFKHNQHYLDDIQNMCRELGVQQFDSVEGNNFQAGNTYMFVDEDGNEQVLEQVQRNVDDSERSVRRVRDHRYNKKAKQYTDIDCISIKSKNLKVSSMGMVSPCCYLSSGLANLGHYKYTNMVYPNLTDEGVSKDGTSPIIQKYLNNVDKFNLNSSSLYDIVASDWFDRDLVNSWSSMKTSCFGCKKVCGTYK